MRQFFSVSQMRSVFVLLALQLGTAMPVWAADVFVVEAKGIDLSPGQQLDGAKPLTLQVGQRVTLVTGDGRTLKLKGPYNGVPAADLVSTAGGVMDSLKGLMTAHNSDTTSAGIIRSGNTTVAQPSPALIEVLHSGDRCILAGETTVLWRADRPQHNSKLEIEPADRSWSASATWPAGAEKLALPANLKLNDGQAYLLSIDAASVNQTVHVIPKGVKSDAAKAAWMIEVGCEAQAEALLEQMR